jgi:hypothetical protein
MADHQTPFCRADPIDNWISGIEIIDAGPAGIMDPEGIQFGLWEPKQE